MPRPHAPSRRIVVLHPGGIGDLVLTETLLAGLREREPGARLELLCQVGVAFVPALYREPPDSVIPIPFNPYRWGEDPGEVAAADIGALAERIGEGVDVLVSAEQNPNPLGACLASLLGVGELIIGSTRGHQASRKTNDLLQRLGASACASIRRLEPILGGEHELDRYARIAGSVRRTPALRPVAADDSNGRTLLVFPFGNSPPDSWPHEQMILAATRIAERYDLSIELIARAKDREAAAALAQRFPVGVSIRVASPAELPEIARAIGSASGYVSLDTGLPHLAAAYGVPGVTIYGGGTWPSFAPWGPKAAGVVSPLPCFGCSWDCAFDRAFCIEGITVEDMVTAFGEVFERAGSGPISVAVDPYSAREREILGAAAMRYRDLQADRHEKYTVIVQLQSACDERSELINRLDDSLRHEQASHNTTRESLGTRIKEFEEVASTRSSLIDQLQTACAERLALIETLSAEVDRLARLLTEAEHRHLVMGGPRSAGDAAAGYSGRSAVSDAESAPSIHLEELRQMSAERAAFIVDLQRRLSVAQEAADERGALIHTLDDNLQRAQATRAQLDEQQAALVLEVDRLHLRIRDLDRTAQDREEEITTLRKACDERMLEIERITAEAERRSALLADMTAAFEAALRRLERQGAGGSPSASRTGGS